MVKHAENLFENIVNKLVLVSLLLIIVMLVLDFTVKDHFLQPYMSIMDLVINSIFIVDLLIIYYKNIIKRKHSFGSFLYHNWLDILACIPLNSLFQVAKLVRLTRIAKLASREGKLVKFAPKAARLKKITWLRGIKGFSKETEVDKHLDYTKESLYFLKLRKLDHELERIYKIISEQRYQ